MPMVFSIELPCLPHTGSRGVSATCSQNLHHRGTDRRARPPASDSRSFIRR